MNNKNNLIVRLLVFWASIFVMLSLIVDYSIFALDSDSDILRLLSICFITAMILVVLIAGRLTVKAIDKMREQ